MALLIKLITLSLRLALRGLRPEFICFVTILYCKRCYTNKIEFFWLCPADPCRSWSGPRASSWQGLFASPKNSHEVFWTILSPGPCLRPICPGSPDQEHMAPDNTDPRFIGTHKPLHHDKVMVPREESTKKGLIGRWIVKKKKIIE